MRNAWYKKRKAKQAVDWMADRMHNQKLPKGGMIQSMCDQAFFGSLAPKGQKTVTRMNPRVLVFPIFCIATVVGVEVSLQGTDTWAAPPDVVLS